MKPYSVLKGVYHGVVLFILLVSPGVALAQEKDPEEPSESYSGFHEAADEIQEGFDLLFKAVGYANVLRPNSHFSEECRYSISGEFRPDFFLDFRRLRLAAKPRATLTWQKWEEDGDFEDEWFINEWLASLGLTRNVFVSYGRENLQWGPSSLFSSSNPFIKANYKTNPLGEVPGMDYARFVWVVNPTWTLSLIANMDEGRQDFPLGFERTYGLKLDFTGNRKYFSLIPSKREGDRGQVGAYAGWNMTDALILHGETAVFHEMNPDYQFERLQTLGPLGLSINPDLDKYSDSEIGHLSLMGASYTLEAGPTLTLEYVYNSAGLSDEQADLLSEGILQIFDAHSSFLGPSMARSPEVLAETIAPELTFLRRNYLMSQYQHIQIRHMMNILLRYTYNLDDHSSRLTPVVSFDVGEHARVYFVGRKNFGSEYTEFQYLYDYSVTLGLEYTF